MSSLKSTIMKSGLIAGLIAGGTFFFRLFKAKSDIELFSNVLLDRIDLQFAYFTILTQINNPTKASFSIQSPFVKVGYNGQIIGSSTPKDKFIKVDAFSQTKLEPIEIKFPLSQSITIASDLVAARQNGKKVLLDVETSTYIKAALLSFPIKHIESINL